MYRLIVYSVTFLLMFSCSNNKGDNIIINANLISINGKPYEVPKGGFNIIIDTLNKEITSDLEGIVGDDFKKSQLNDSLFLYYNIMKKNIHYTIDSLEHKPNNGILFYTSVGSNTFLSAYVDSTYSIRTNNLDITYLGTSEAKKINNNLNEAKRIAYKALIGK